MKRFILFVLFLMITLLGLEKAAVAQNRIRYEYDQNGNREYRKVIVLQSKSATIASQLQEEEVVETQLGSQEIRIYPNPTKGVLRIDMPELNETTVNLGIFDSRGSLLIKKQAQGAGTQLDLSSYPSGMYILIISTKEDKREWKIIKE